MKYKKKIDRVRKVHNYLEIHYFKKEKEKIEKKEKYVLLFIIYSLSFSFSSISLIL